MANWPLQTTALPLPSKSGVAIIRSILGDQMMVRLLPLLLIAVGLTLPADAAIGTPATPLVEASTTVQLLAKRMSMACRNCKTKACSAMAVACSAHCPAATALLPTVAVLATVVPRATGPSGMLELPDHHGPPGPHPPRSIAIS